MSYSWTTTGDGFTDDPQDVHTLSCLIWESPNPTDTCDCGSDDFQAGVQTWIDRFDSHAPEQHGRAS